MGKRKKGYKRSDLTRKCVQSLRKQGWWADTVERWCGPITRDYLGIADVLALRPGPEVLLVQVTSYGNEWTRVDKLIDGEKEMFEMVAGLLHGGIQIEVWGYKSYNRGVRRIALWNEEGTVGATEVEYYQ